ncbi:SPOR domain-containing protein [Arenicella xantha]|uniref:Sporulation related protein n=1 Tax=Arenicella xantha TaxID=644221 RepID=A0A395JGX7_9GAMM|nr:SPOR domain-containing protein [Arenicella xantha]RBP48695.1 sporulation related protein [Arenicella xantha]
MAQARRIKKKPPAKSKKNRRAGSIPWGLLLVVLVTGIILGKLIAGAQHDGDGLGSGLRALIDNIGSEPIDDDEAIAELIEEKSTEKEFDFYLVLPDIEQVMPDDLPEAAPSRKDDSLVYYVQAASFRQQADAEKLRARLALKGFKSITQARTSVETGTFYRVRLGPYEDRRKAKTAKNKLQHVGVRPMVYSVKKES